MDIDYLEGYTFHTTGGCFGTNELDSFNGVDVRGCADMCNADSSCKSFTHSKDGTICQLLYSCTYEDSQKDESSDFDFYEKVQYDSSRVRQLQVVMFDAPFDCTEVVNFIQEKAELKKPFFAELDNIYSNDLGSIRYEPHQTDDGNCKVQIIVPPDPDEDRNSTEFACEFERTALKLLEENDTLENLKQEHPKVYKWVKRITPSLAHGCDFGNGDDVQSVCDNVNCDQFDAVEKDCRLNEYDVEEDEERGLDDPEIGKFLFSATRNASFIFNTHLPRPQRCLFLWFSVPLLHKQEEV